MTDPPRKYIAIDFVGFERPREVLFITRGITARHVLEALGYGPTFYLADDDKDVPIVPCSKDLYGRVSDGDTITCHQWIDLMQRSFNS